MYYYAVVFLFLFIMLLQGKKVLLGITGSIAAYKSIFLTRLLIKEGAEVKVVMTKAATDFASPLVLSTLSKNKVIVEISSENVWANHVQLGRWADVFLIAPASCNTIAKMATGICDNLLMATYLSATCPVVVAPAMDEDMWHHPSTKRNLNIITSFGNKVMEVKNGELASGLIGEGRMDEPENILTYLLENVFRGTALKGKKFLVTAGPTFEPIDPVRFIGNHSSGKMGYALAREIYINGGEVTLISGPSNEIMEYKGVKWVKVKSAADMFETCKNHFHNTDVLVMNAAVADYTPSTVYDEKMKKGADDWSIDLKKTIDILHFCGVNKQPNQFIMGFALETNNEERNAIDKLHRKNIDCIVLNSLKIQGAGFSGDNNEVTIINKDETKIHFKLQSKTDIAVHIVSYLTSKL